MKVLIVEDEPVSRYLLQTLLNKWGYDVWATSNGSEAWAVLRGPEAPSLVISDWIMPGMDGLELCRKIREKVENGYIYFIILTAKGRREDVVKGLEAGADDYLVKPFDQEELRYRIGIGKRIIELERRNLQLAFTDSLTGVLNRRAFVERVEEEIHRCNRKHSPFSLVLVDIDRFKRINDRFGHQVGDLVLKRFAERLSKSSRRYDLVGRFGGEEFVVCLPDTNYFQARPVAERMRRTIEDMEIPLSDSSQFIKVTASFGVASKGSEPEESVDSILRCADDALYKAKREGRNRVSVATEESVGNWG